MAVIIAFDELNDDIPLRVVNDEIQKNNVEWDYHVSTNESYKYVTMVDVVGTEREFDLYLAELTKQSKKQFELVQYFLSDYSSRPLTQVLSDLSLIHI